MESEANQDLFLEKLQGALDDPHHRLGNLRPQALCLLQDIVAASHKLPAQVKILQVQKRGLIYAGGSAFIWSGNIGNKPVIVWDARPPQGHNWASPEGQEILLV
ncbi:hypothetical protein DL93DRAFT_832063 [Clavulina sp. PMI_390]|nr:hypothetical protein DL93DRAFT_832063 [Clavulina sp. PMI_390]